MKRSLAERLRAGGSPGDLLSGEVERLRVGPFKEDAFTSPLHSERAAALLGIALGVAFLTCFVTGLMSHLIQHPLDVGFLSWPAGPAWLFRFTQGLHVATGTAAVPLLLAKLWTVFPRLFTWPPARGVTHMIERITIVPLVAGSLFQLASGISNLASWYPWTFNFTAAHFWTAWITIGSLVIHIGAKLPITRRSLGREAREAPQPRSEGLSRKGFLTTVAAACGLVTLTTVGQTLGPLSKLDLLGARRPDIGPQGFPVNKTAAGASVLPAINDPGWELSIEGNVANPVKLSLELLRALPQREAHLPIACVEGWSAGVNWRGVPVADLLKIAGAPPGDHHVTVHSLQKKSQYSSSTLNPAHVKNRDTMLALEANGATLHVDHGFPCRLIAPSLPGVHQTKWITRMVVA